MPISTRVQPAADEPAEHRQHRQDDAEEQHVDAVPLHHPHRVDAGVDQDGRHAVDVEHARGQVDGGVPEGADRAHHAPEFGRAFAKRLHHGRARTRRVRSEEKQGDGPHREDAARQDRHHPLRLVLFRIQAEQGRVRQPAPVLRARRSRKGEGPGGEAQRHQGEEVAQGQRQARGLVRLIQPRRPDQQRVVQDLGVGKQDADQGGDHQGSGQAQAAPVGLGPPQREDHHIHQDDDQGEPGLAPPELVDGGAEEGRGGHDRQAGIGAPAGDQLLALDRISDHHRGHIGHEDVDGDEDDVGVSRPLEQRPAIGAQGKLFGGRPRRLGERNQVGFLDDLGHARGSLRPSFTPRPCQEP